MLSKNLSLIGIYIALLACSPNGSKPNVSNRTEAQLSDIEAHSIQSEIDQLLEIDKDSGTVSAITGLTISDKLATTSNPSATE